MLQPKSTVLAVNTPKACMLLTLVHDHKEFSPYEHAPPAHLMK